MSRAGWALLLLTGCLHPLQGLTRREPVDTALGRFQLAAAPEDASDLFVTARAVERAAPVLEKWGPAPSGVTVYLAPSHRDLERAVGRDGYAWLRAWARFDEVIVQTPRSWPGPGAAEGDLDELLLHELTHCVMYQNAATEKSWDAKRIPLWFREGMATYTAHQGSRFASLEDLARFYQQHPTDDPLLDPDPLYQRHSELVYGAAHQAFEFLVRRHSEDAARRLLRSMRAGRTFPQAFVDVLGIEEHAFLLDVQHYIKWRGFKGSATVHAASPIQPR